MNVLDWGIVVVYLAGMIYLSFHLGKKQTDMKSYYLGGNNLSWWSIGISTMATQCSTNSLLGAPAFIITTGLLWLQYEFAVPLAMIIIMIFLLPFYRKLNLVSIYEYLERRFDVGTRTILSLLFQFLRAFGTGVTVYGIGIVLEQILGIAFWKAVLLLGIVTIIYDMLGGMEAVVLSDVIQMAILYLGILFCLIFSIKLVGGFAAIFALFPKTGDTIQNFLQSNPGISAGNLSFSGFKSIDLAGHGFGDGKNFAFFPMLFGGLFLYVSYYGCDQTQVQRELSSKDLDDTNMSLVLNGLMRFPLVLTYCFMGVCIGAFIVKNPDFLKTLVSGSKINFNLAVPKFILAYLPHGIIGLVIVALFSAAMSSLDSTINSLSATTIKDIYERFFVEGGELPVEKQLNLSRIFTVFWGVVCVAFSFFVGNISNSVIESINKIGSLANGPILALFLMGILTRRVNGIGATWGLILGFGGNCLLWIFAPGVSWLWWNVIGFFVAYGSGYLISTITSLTFEITEKPDKSGYIAKPVVSDPTAEELKGLIYTRDIAKYFEYKRNWPRWYVGLVCYCILMILICAGISTLG
ncbi:sodium:solute symporter [Candidatus Riflebacteria bacterium]